MTSSQEPVSKHELRLESQFTFPLFSLKVNLLKKIKDVSIKGSGIHLIIFKVSKKFRLFKTDSSFLCKITLKL